MQTSVLMHPIGPEINWRIEAIKGAQNRYKSAY